MSDREVAVLLCEAGGLVIAVDCADVHAVVPKVDSERDRAFADRIFGRAIRAGKEARLLVLQRSTGARVVVDRVLGMRSLARAELLPVPASLRAFGVADWVLGLAELEQGFVWLLDLALAAAESAAERSS